MNYKDMSEAQYRAISASLEVTASVGDAGAMLAHEVLNASRSLYFLEQDMAADRRFLRDIGA